MHDGIVDDLGAASRTHRAEVVDALGDGLEDRPGAGKIRLAATDEKRVPAGGHGLHAAGYGRVHEAHIGAGAERRELARHLRGDRAGLDDQSRRAAAGGEGPDNVDGDIGPRQGEQNDIGGGDRRLQRLLPGYLEVLYGGRSARVDIESGQRKFSRQRVRQGCAGVAKADYRNRIAH